MFNAPIRYFLGTNTATGYRSTAATLYEPTDGWRVYLLKSGPGTGKSSFLKQVYDRAVKEGETAEVFFCSGDPRSLDGVRLPERRVCVLDATDPHAIEPLYWGGCEQVIPLCVGVDERRLYDERIPLREAIDASRAAHARCRRLLSGAAAFAVETARTVTVNKEKLAAQVQRLTQQETEHGNGQEHTRMLTAFTPEGLSTWWETVQALCPRIFVIVDEEGAVAPLFFKELNRQTAGREKIVSPSPLFPDAIDQLLFPAAGVAFVTANNYHSVEFPVYRRIHATRFYNGTTAQNASQFRRKTIRELLKGAAEAAREGAAFHDAAEKITREAVDWAVVEEIKQRALSRIFDAR